MSETTFPVTLSELLSRRDPRKLQMEHRGRAAVLMPAWKLEDECFFLLTQRTHKVETHKGQISFPGGVRDSGDESLLHTALRETWEEIGLPPEKVQVLGRFDEYFSVTGLIVTPFLGWIRPPLELKPNPEEVDEVLYVPWSLFRDPDLLRVETRRRFDREMAIYHYDFQGRDVWGLTAQIIRDFLKVLEADTLSGRCTPAEGAAR